ncbi:BTB/POZ domain-containing protein 6-like [Haliotis rufescens]|uniref:BTB/POZ domain-containing protein 6-like n=1 Tax=Haliotis rufescens TaxID=6454 RepID=UPI001EAFD352|nr:BTB/POZ domain-containing protein 6-like [Haliotis rufescens]XP_048255467.1 BTB/POZ domain-containing protein 6-like [Haliotis rufescens]
MDTEEIRGDNSGFVNNWQGGKSLAECNLYMLTSEDSYDVSFLVGKEEKLVRAHRYVLMSRSCVFHAMLCGPLAEKEDIKVPDVEEETFTEMLRYLYTDTSSLTAENVTGVLYLAKKYAVGVLERLCVTYLVSSLTAENACVILEQAHVFDEEELFDRALKFIVQNGDVAGFTGLCGSCFHRVVSAEEFIATDDTAFSAALSWAEAECKRQGREITPENKRLVLGDTVYEVDFTLMDMKLFAKTVVPSGILSGDECTKLLCYLISPDTDVAPFKMKSKLNMGVALYADRIHTGHCQEDSSIIFSCSEDIRLTGLWAFGNASCTYNISLYEEQQTNASDGGFTSVKRWVPREVSTVLERSISNEVQLQLRKQFSLYNDFRYKIEMTRTSIKNGWSGSSVFNNISLGKCQISVAEQSGPGLISRLMLEEM